LGTDAKKVRQKSIVANVKFFEGHKEFIAVLRLLAGVIADSPVGERMDGGTVNSS
jgi:hypothetical protein